MTDRNRLRVESNERLDLGDLMHFQRAMRVAIRYAMRGLIFGAASPTAGGIFNATQRYWDVSTSGSEVTVTQGISWAGELMADATIEHGAVVGTDGDASQTLDLVGQPANTYYIYVRSDWSSGQSGSRVFWNGTTDEEDVAAIDTREVSGWKADYATSSPGNEYLQVGKVVWDGAAFTSSSDAGEYLFEGALDDSGVETTPEWGDAGNDRNTNRAQYGIKNLRRWMAATRRQVSDIIGTGTWFDALPQTAVDTPGSPVDLAFIRDHIDQVADPHSDGPSWSGTVNILTGGELQIDSGANLDVNGSFNFDQRGTFETAFYLPTSAGLADLPRFDDDVIQGFISARYVGVAQGLPRGADGTFLFSTGAGWISVLDSGPVTDASVYYDITNLFATGCDATGAYLKTLGIYLREASGMTGGFTACEVSLYTRGVTTTAPTLLFTTGVLDSSLSGSVQFIDLTSSITALSDANRTIKAGQDYTIRVRLYTENGVADSPFFSGLLIGASEKHLHP